MPPVFTEQFANLLNTMTDITVKEAKQGEKVLDGHCYIAPGDYHMTVERKNDGCYIHLNQDEKVCYVRPSADVLFNSVAQAYRARAFAIVLTGMGQDGMNGCRALKEYKVPVVVQDEQSCTVWGMPGAVYKEGLHDVMVPGIDVAKIIEKIG